MILICEDNVVKFYMVGGAVRDQLLGLPIQDRDWVVIGATPDQMLAAGYLPVGKDFPVFLHPETHEEYALARTERKTAPGYHGFAFHADASVTLEEDLARRDLTINAIALGDDGQLIDPYGGKRDLQAKILRHVTSAFAEDPVRILRTARFAARYEGFTVAPETMQLMQQMVSCGEVDALVAERVWQELSRGLLEQKPSRMFSVLRECVALQHIMPEIENLFHEQRHISGITKGAHILNVLDYAADQNLHHNSALAISFALLTYQLPSLQAIEAFCKRLRVPFDCKDLAVLAHHALSQLHHAPHISAQQAFSLLQRTDAFRQTTRFQALLCAAKIDACTSSIENQQQMSYPQSQMWQQALDAAMSVDTSMIARRLMSEGKKGIQIGEAINTARLNSVNAIWGSKC